MAKEPSEAPVQAPEENETAEVKPVKRRTRRAQTPEEKQTAAQKRAEKKEKAEALKPIVLVQYQEVEVDVDALVEAAKAQFRAEKKRTQITDFKLYIKPEDKAAYYVINEKFDGKVEF